MTLDEREKVTREFQRIAEQGPKYAYAYCNWGLAGGKKKYDDAIEQYRDLSELRIPLSWTSIPC